MFSKFALPNTPRVTRLTIGVTAPDGKRAELKFVAAKPDEPLMAVVDETPEPPAPSQAELDEQFLIANDWQREPGAFETVYRDPFGGAIYNRKNALEIQAHRDDMIERFPHDESATQDRAIVRVQFINCKPSAFDSLGEIAWECVNPHCDTCNKDLSADEISFRNQIYDGLCWSNPHCVHCNSYLLGEPIDSYERAIVRAQRNP